MAKPASSMRARIWPAWRARTASGLMMANVRSVISERSYYRARPSRPGKVQPGLPESVHDLVEHRLRRPDLLRGQEGQRLVGQVQEVDEVVLVGLDVEDAGGKLAAARGLVEEPGGRQLVGRVVILGYLAQEELRPVMHLDGRRRPRLVLDVDVFKVRHEADLA